MEGKIKKEKIKKKKWLISGTYDTEKNKDKNKQPTKTVTNLTWVEEIEQRNDEIFQLKNI